MLVVPSLTCLVLRKEFWPFSHYPMFANSYEKALLWCGLFGVTEKQEEIFLGFQPFLPLDSLQFCSSLIEDTLPEPRLAPIEKTLAGLWRVYNFNHRKNPTKIPKITALKYFLIRWHGTNPKMDFFHPEKVRFIAQVANDAR